MSNIGLDKDIDAVIAVLNNKIDTDQLTKIENNINDTITEVTLDIQETKNIINNLDIGVTSFNGNKGDITYTAPVSSVNGATGAVVVDTISDVCPDYSAHVTVTMPYTAPSKGWFIAFALNTNVNVYINGVQVAIGNWNSGDWTGDLNCQILVDKGDVITGAAGTMRFIPCKGA